jgi:hypothetical protein
MRDSDGGRRALLVVEDEELALDAADGGLLLGGLQRGTWQTTSASSRLHATAAFASVMMRAASIAAVSWLVGVDVVPIVQTALRAPPPRPMSPRRWMAMESGGATTGRRHLARIANGASFPGGTRPRLVQRCASARPRSGPIRALHRASKNRLL